MSDIVFSEDAFEQYLYWQSQDKKTLSKINKLIKSINRTPFEGEGKSEPLKNEDGKWSRRINDKDRHVYSVKDGKVIIYQCRKHYDDK